jgi:hypothetical protein
MMKRIARVVPVLSFLLAGSGVASPLLTLTPANGFIEGGPSETVGWGYTLSNDTSFYLLVDASYFCQLGEDPAFTTCTQTLGTYTDFIASNLTIISPHSSTSQTFDPNFMTGVGSYTIDPSAPLYSMDTGSVVATYQEYMGNPLVSGTQVSGDIELSASAMVEAVPEPATLTLAGGSLLFLCGLAFCRTLKPPVSQRPAARTSR